MGVKRGHKSTWLKSAAALPYPDRALLIAENTEPRRSQIVVSDMARSLSLVLCLAAAPSACALSSRRRVTPAFPHVGQMHSRTATGPTTVMELRGGSLLSEHQLLSYVAYAVASTAAAGSAIALIGALAVLGWVKKPILSESGARSRRWRSSGSRCLSSQQPMWPPTTPTNH